MSKHILVVSQYYYPENFRINDITTEWVKRGYKVTVITGIPNYPKGKFYKGYGFFKKRKEVFNGVKVIRLALIPRFNNSIFLALNYISFVIAGWFWARFTRIKADLVFNFEVSPMTQALPAIWYAKRRKIPSYIYVQDLWPENLQIVGGINNKFIIKRVNKMVDKIYKNAEKILVTSQSFKDSIVQRKVSQDKVLVWHQFAEDFYVPLTTSNDSKSSKLRIVFTGNIGEAQGLEILPKAALELKKKEFNNLVVFKIVGDGRNKNKLIDEIETIGVKDMFEFYNQVPAIEVPKILSESDVAFVSFKNNELFSKTIPAKLQSYMACGKPILAVALGETKRIVEESNSGLVSNPDDVLKLVDNIIHFISHKGNLSIMSKNSVEYYQRNFNKKTLLDEFDVIISER
jgi:glycosyltransferase involved in cell wall biosynthesis